MVVLKTETDVDNIQQVNKLKGMSLEKLVYFTFRDIKSDIKSEQTLKSIIKKNNEYLKNIYGVRKTFKLIDESGNEIIFKPKPRKGGYETEKYRIVFNLNDFLSKSNEFFTVAELSRYEKITTGWKRCPFCGQYIKAEDQRTRKCMVCKKGYFRTVYKERKKAIWVTAYKGRLKSILDFLLSNNFIKKINFNIKVDNWRYKDGHIYIYESKNLEKTGLQNIHVVKCAYYVLGLKYAGLDCNRVSIIFNGPNDPQINEFIKNFCKFRGIKINIISVKKWLQNYCKFTKKLIKSCEVFHISNYPDSTENTELIKMGKDSKYVLKIEFQYVEDCGKIYEIPLFIRCRSIFDMVK